MKRIEFAVVMLILSSMLMSLFSCSPAKEVPQDEAIDYGTYIYVSVDGNDANDGSKESPLCSLTGARDKIRSIKENGGIPDGGICVIFTDGTYSVNKTTEFTDVDSGEAGKPIVYMAENKGKVRLNAGFSLNYSDFKPIGDNIKDILVSDEAKEKVLVIDLEAAGCTDLEEREYCYFAVSDSVARWQTTEQALYVGGERQTVSRWPNGEYYTVPDYVEAAFGDPDYYTLSNPSEHSEKWANESGQIMYYGYPLEDYVGYYLKVTDINAENGNITIEVPNYQKLTLYCPIYFFNLLCELDSPGEYYTDYKAKKLYYYPKEGFESEPIVFTQLTEDIISGSNVDYITFDGFILEGTRNNAINLTGNYQSFLNLEVRNVGIQAMNLNGNNITVAGCYVHDIDGKGITVNDDSWQGSTDADSPTNTLEYSNVLITNNEIAFYGQKYGISSPAIDTKRYGTVISHNVIHDNAHNAICWNAQNVTIEYNEIYNVCKEVDDCGAVTTGRNRDARGTVIRYNYIHDITAMLERHPNAIYLDDTTEQHTVYGNVIVNIGGRAVAISGDRHVKIQNNIFLNANCISWDNRGLIWGNGMWDYPEGTIWANLLVHPIYSDLWKYSFPMNLLYGELSPRDAKYVDYFGTPAYADVSRNVSGELYGFKYYKLAEQGIDPNMWEETEYKFSGLLEISPDAIRYGTFNDNASYLHISDIGFVDEANGNYNLSDDSPVFRDIVGFEKIPFDEIGLLK